MSDEEIKKLLKRPVEGLLVLNIAEEVELLETYILEKKRVKVVINQPITSMEILMVDRAANFVFDFYWKKLFKTEE